MARLLLYYNQPKGKEKRKKVVNMLKVKVVSKHMVEDRMDRVLAIAQYVGWGEIMIEVVDHNDVNRVLCFTTTGVMLVKGRGNGKLITAYVPTLDKVVAILSNSEYGSVPNYLLRKVKQNHTIMRKLGLS